MVNKRCRSGSETAFNIFKLTLFLVESLEVLFLVHFELCLNLLHYGEREKTTGNRQKDINSLRVHACFWAYDHYAGDSYSLTQF